MQKRAKIGMRHGTLSLITDSATGGTEFQCWITQAGSNLHLAKRYLSNDFVTHPNPMVPSNPYPSALNTSYTIITILP